MRGGKSVEIFGKDWLQFIPQLGTVHPPDVEVLHIHIPIGGSLPLAPKQQTLLSRGL